MAQALFRPEVIHGDLLVERGLSLKRGSVRWASDLGSSRFLRCSRRPTSAGPPTCAEFAQFSSKHKLVGFRVKAARESKGWTQDRLTEGLGLKDRQSVSDIENGKRMLRTEEMPKPSE